MRRKPVIKWYMVRQAALLALRNAGFSSGEIATLAGTNLRQVGESGQLYIVTTPAAGQERSHQLSRPAQRALLEWVEAARVWGQSTPLFVDRQDQPIKAAAIRAAWRRAI